MHDDTIEQRLRAALRAEADGLPLTVTPDELERRLALRRRDRANRRLGLLAAGLAALAVGTVFAVGFGPFRSPDVANTPLPSLLPSTPPSVGPTAAATIEATARPAEPLGTVEEAILIRPIGGDPRRPDSFGVSVVKPGFDRPRVIATLPGSILPTDGWLDGGERGPTISVGGYVALPFTRGPNEDASHPAIVVVDVLSPAAEAQILDGYVDPMWGPTEHLAVRNAATSEVEVFRVGSGFDSSADAPEPASVVAWSMDAGTRFVGTQGDSWGTIGFDGSFTATIDLPAVYQRTGIERPTGVDTHTLGMGCDSAPTGGACILGEWADPNEGPVRVWYTAGEDGPQIALLDQTWATDGRSVLLLQRVEGEPYRAIDALPLTPGYEGTILVHRAPGSRTMITGVQLPSHIQPTILGISAEPTAGRPTLTAVGDVNGRVFAFFWDLGTVQSAETFDGGSWFAGWADDPAPYDPD